MLLWSMGLLSLFFLSSCERYIPGSLRLGRPPTVTETTKTTSASDCAGLELVEVTTAGGDYGIHQYVAYVRNTSNQSKLARVRYLERGASSAMRVAFKAPANDIVSVKLVIAERPPKDVSIVDCH